MNIFVLDTDPFKAASFHNDCHTIKMIVESAQILCTVLREQGHTHEWLYKATHKNHPCVLWAKSDPRNFNWLLNLLGGLLHEYRIRFGKPNKPHKTTEIFLNICKLSPNPSQTWEMPDSFVLCMPDHFKIPSDPVLSYRAYYLAEKRKISKWKLGNKPEWFE